MKRSVIRGRSLACGTFPDCASLHPSDGPLAWNPARAIVNWGVRPFPATRDRGRIASCVRAVPSVVTSSYLTRRTLAQAALVPLALAWPRGAAADADMIAQMRDIVANELSPTATPDQPGGLAAALYAGSHVEYFNYGFADSATRRPVTPA